MLILDKKPAIKNSQWRLMPVVAPSPELQQLASKKNLHPVIVKILAGRGLQDQKSIEEFLEPRLADLPHPMQMGGMKEAAALAGEAVLTGTPILIWGDYDVDGTTGTALLISFFRKLGVEAAYTIPNRISHGYGLHLDLLQAFAPAESGQNTLLITVDCGISAQKEILAAREMGFQVLVTDHHEPPQGGSCADAVLNPKQSDCTFPTEELAGVGVAFYLACGIRQYLREKNYFHENLAQPDVRDLLDLVALGTIADMVPLGKVNRTLVKEGMRRIEAQQRPGIAAMLGVSGLVTEQMKLIGNIRSEDIGFLLAPMINAAGRLAEAAVAVQLLLSDNLKTAMPLARELLTLNNSRKVISQEVFTSAIDQQGLDTEKHNCLILKGNYHHGVIGIVASRLVEKYHLPVILFSQENDHLGKRVLKGSGRSIPGINLHTALENCAELMIRYGGHAMAAGMSVAEDAFDQFSARINEEIGKQKKDGEPVTLTIDLEAEIDEIFSADCRNQLQLLEPFGPGNTSPVFCARKAAIVECKPIGMENAHLKISFHNNGAIQKGIGFGLGSYSSLLDRRKNLAVAYSPMANRYRDTFTWEVRVIGFQHEQKEQEAGI